MNLIQGFRIIANSLLLTVLLCKIRRTIRLTNSASNWRHFEIRRSFLIASNCSEGFRSYSARISCCGFQTLDFEKWRFDVRRQPSLLVRFEMISRICDTFQSIRKKILNFRSSKSIDFQLATKYLTKVSKPDSPKKVFVQKIIPPAISTSFVM